MLDSIFPNLYTNITIHQHNVETSPEKLQDNI